MFQALGPTRGPGRLALESEGLRGRPDLQGESSTCPMPRGVNQTSQATPAWLRGPTVSHSSPGTLALWTDGPRGRPAVQRPLWSTDFPGRLRPVPEGPWYGPPLPGDSSSGPRSRSLPAFPGDLGMCQMSRGVDQLSRGTQARVQDPVVSTSCPGELYPGPKTSRIHQLPRATRTRV